MKLQFNFSKRKTQIILFFILLEALFLRIYNYRDWLHFQLDQSRDTLLLNDAMNKGIQYLPLMGPRAGGSFLRLGPIFYYFEYLVSLVVQKVTPVTMAIPDLIFGLAFIPLLYLFLRELFDKKWSLLLTFLIANSTFMITYDRFAWNPNILPFFSLLCFYSWIKYWKKKREGNKKSSILWIGLVALALGVLFQTHFVAFISVPIILSLSLIIFWVGEKYLYPPESKENAVFTKSRFMDFVKEFAIFVGIIIITQAPVIVNEIISQGTNTKELFLTVQEKDNKDSRHTTLEKLVQNLWVYPKGYWLITTGNMSVEYPDWNFSPKFDIKCNASCRAYFSGTILGAIFWLFTVLIFVLSYIKITKDFNGNFESKSKEEKIVQWQLYTLTALWIIIPWWAFFPISFQLRPRFFLIAVAPFAVMLGIFLKKIDKKFLGRITALVILLLLLVSNSYETWARFERQSSAINEHRKTYPRDLILFQDEKYPVTLEQEEQISNWIIEKNKAEASESDMLFVWAPAFYYRPILYFIDEKYPQKAPARYLAGYPTWTKGDYYAVIPTGQPGDFFKAKRQDLFQIKDQKFFGTLTIFHLELTPKGIEAAKTREESFSRNQIINSDERQNAKCLKKPKATCRFVWEDFYKKMAGK